MGAVHQRLIAGAAIVATSALFGASQAQAQTDRVESQAVRTLVSQLDADLARLGCDASLQEYVSVLQATVATSGADPSTVEEALRLVEATPSLCVGARPALADLDRTVSDSIGGAYYATSNGPGPGSPIGPPGSDSAGGGSDYRH